MDSCYSSRKTLSDFILNVWSSGHEYRYSSAGRLLLDLVKQIEKPNSIFCSIFNQSFDAYGCALFGRRSLRHLHYIRKSRFPSTQNISLALPGLHSKTNPHLIFTSSATRAPSSNLLGLKDPFPCILDSTILNALVP